MNEQLPTLLAWTFLGSLVLGLLKTSRWVAIIMSVLAVWGAGLQQADIDRVTAGTIEGYIWFGVLTLAVWIPTIAVSLVASDLGALLLRIRAPAESEEVADEEPEQATE